MKQTWDKDHGSISVTIPLNAKRHIIKHTIKPKHMPNVCVNDKTDEVIIFIEKLTRCIQ